MGLVCHAGTALGIACACLRAYFRTRALTVYVLPIAQPVAKDDVVIEYVGEAIRQSVADERERRYTAVNIGRSDRSSFAQFQP